MKSIFYFVITGLIAINANAQIPVKDIAGLINNAKFDVIAETNLNLEADLAVFLIDPLTKCKFLGKTRAEPKEGFFNNLFDRKNYFIDVNSAVCENDLMEFNKVSASYELPVKAGEKVYLPLFDTLEKISPRLESIKKTKDALKKKLLDSGVNPEKLDELLKDYPELSNKSEN